MLRLPKFPVQVGGCHGTTRKSSLRLHKGNLVPDSSDFNFGFPCRPSAFTFSHQNSVAMMIKTCLCTLALLWLPLVDAQYGGGGSSSSTTPTTTTASSTNTASASSTIQSVDVGKSGFTFNPNTIHVPAGGVVEFHFYPGAHSVAQAAFNNPCHPMSDTSFFSGFMTSANNGQVIS